MHFHNCACNVARFVVRGKDSWSELLTAILVPGLLFTETQTHAFLWWFWKLGLGIRLHDTLLVSISQSLMLRRREGGKKRIQLKSSILELPVLYHWTIMIIQLPSPSSSQLPHNSEDQVSKAICSKHNVSGPELMKHCTCTTWTASSLQTGRCQPRGTS